MSSARCLGSKPVCVSSRSAQLRGVTQPLKLSGPVVRRSRSNKTVCMAASIAAEDVPDMNKRIILNWMLAGASGLPIVLMAIPYFSFFVPKGTGGSGGAQVAKDALGNDVELESWKKTHLAGDRSLTQGLKGDPTYLVVKDDNSLESYGINAVCTHLGCVVPWIQAEKKYKCPCHGSQYDGTGKVVRGPAPLSLALAHCDVSPDGLVLFSTWTETDFRTDTKPWWT